MKKQRIEVRSHLEISETVLIFIAGSSPLLVTECMGQSTGRWGDACESNKNDVYLA